jgi:hypothetical protein
MDLFEHQAKELFAKYGVAVPRGKVAWSPDEAETAAAEVGSTVVVKAQVQIGGRGKAGGIKLAADPAEARAHAERIIGMDIRGHTVRRVLVEQASEIAAEYYVAILHDRASKGFLAMGGQSDELNTELQRGYDEDMTLDAALQLAMRVLRQAAPAGETGNSRLEVAVLERDRPRRSFRRLTQEDVESRAGEPAS